MKNEIDIYNEALRQSSRDFYLALLGMCLAAGVALIVLALATDDAHAEDLNLEHDFIDPNPFRCGEHSFDIHDPELFSNMCNRIAAQDAVSGEKFALEERISQLEAEKEVSIKRLASARRTIRKLKRNR
ncbi:hypothetical protein UFOVP591_40 [uncultured Caudovirales phage]|uniref:Uncharacterized protein n=1 Tax=uncultured Caudovirales phage TaxID=2100421 RepID=A0A6J5N0P8_9CAUD|nr:hypothetical protein UFOVP591_40 [uncultured Caudovirales phage]